MATVLGIYQNVYLGHANDTNIRYSSASGGLVTALLIFALEQGIIDGAIVTRMKDDKPLEPLTFIARTKEELLASARSKYCPVPANIVLTEVLKAPGKYAAVGLPCHLQGLRKAEEVFPELKTKIIYTLGLMCSHADSFCMTDILFKWLNINPNDVQDIAYRGHGWPGELTVTLRDGTSKNVSFDKYSIYHELELFTPPRCLMCPDLSNRQADIVFGDAWKLGIKDHTGTSIAVTRTVAGEELLQLALKNQILNLEEMSDDVKKRWCPSAYRLKLAAGYMFWRRVFQKKIPRYNISFPIPGIVGHTSAIACYWAGVIGKQRGLWNILIPIIPLIRPVIKQLRACVSKIMSR
jgi:coenzyme F420 hydrogenase subunit beta